MEILVGVAAAVGVVVGIIQLYKWWRDRRPAAAPSIEDKWVSLRYVEDAGIAQRLRDQGYQFGWVTANNEATKIDIEGYEPVIDELPDGRRLRYKVRDDPVVGGYLILLRKRATQA